MELGKLIQNRIQIIKGTSILLRDIAKAEFVSVLVELKDIVTHENIRGYVPVGIFKSTIHTYKIWMIAKDSIFSHVTRQVFLYIEIDNDPANYIALYRDSTNSEMYRTFANNDTKNQIATLRCKLRYSNVRLGNCNGMRLEVRPDNKYPSQDEIDFVENDFMLMMNRDHDMETMIFNAKIRGFSDAEIKNIVYGTFYISPVNDLYDFYSVPAFKESKRLGEFYFNAV